jgi:ABC-type transport system involved in Fe-S cluster assembly fused permease/ATPase subunit
MRVGVVGPSGSGKSTLVNLLTRFYDPTDGSILIDGTDLREFDLSDLRQQFSIVLQEPMLFTTTIAGNIAYANPEASRVEVIRAATLANAHEFIERLPQGYDTPMGDGAISLSGGERQRLAIARAFLKDTSMLILDEPTSAVDVRTEQLIMEALDKLMTGRTAFMIAHRLSTLERCDAVLVLQNGSLQSITNSVDDSRTRLLAHTGRIQLNWGRCWYVTKSSSRKTSVGRCTSTLIFFSNDRKSQVAFDQHFYRLRHGISGPRTARNSRDTRMCSSHSIHSIRAGGPNLLCKKGDHTL